MTSSLWSSTFFLHISWSIVNVNVSTHLTHSVSWFQQLCRWQFNLFSFNLGVVISSPRLWQKKLHPFKFKIPRALFPRAAAISFFLSLALLLSCPFPIVDYSEVVHSFALSYRYRQYRKVRSRSFLFMPIQFSSFNFPYFYSWYQLSLPTFYVNFSTYLVPVWPSGLK